MNHENTFSVQNRKLLQELIILFFRQTHQFLANRQYLYAFSSIIYQEQKMGNSAHLEEVATKKQLLTQDWSFIRKAEEVQIVRHNKYQYEGEIRVIVIDPKREISDEIKLLEKRKSLQGPLVELYGYEEMEAETMRICGNEKSIKVLTERITNWGKISHQNLSFPEIVYMLKTTIIGYQILHDLVGAFEITHKMFGINCLKQVKVWLNEDFASNHVSRERSIIMNQKSQNVEFASTKKGMVKNILELIERRTPLKSSAAFEELKNMMQSQGFDDFQSAIKLIDHFTKQKRITLCNCISQQNFVDSMHHSPYNKKRPASNLSNNQRQNRPSFSGLEVLSRTIRPISNQVKPQKQQQKEEQKTSHPPIKNRPTPEQQKHTIETPLNFHTRLHFSTTEQPHNNLYEQLLQNPNINTTESVYRPLASQKSSSQYSNFQKMNNLDVFVEKINFRQSSQNFNKPSQTLNKHKTNIVFNYNNNNRNN